MSYTPLNLQDRVPGKAGRVLITPEGGGTPFYAVMTPADEPVTEGSKVNAAVFEHLEGGIEEAIKREYLAPLYGGSLSSYILSAYNSGITRGHFSGGDFAEAWKSSWAYLIEFYEGEPGQRIEVQVTETSTGVIRYNELYTNGNWIYSWQQLATAEYANRENLPGLSGSSLSAYISAAYSNGIKRGYFIAGNFAEQLAANYYHDVWYYAHADNYALVFMEQQSVGGVWYNELNTQTGSYNFSAWKQLVTTDNPSFFGASTFDGVATFKNNHDWTSAVFGGKDGTDIVALGNVSGGAAIQGVDSGVATPKNLAINPFGGGVYANNSKVITEASIPAYYPRARASATYSDSIAAGGSLFKTIPFNAGAEPKKLLLYFLSNSRGARVAALKDSTGNYLFHMGGIVYENGGGFMGGEWVRDFVSDNDLLRGGLGDLALGSGGALALKNVTFNASGVTLEFHDYGEATTLMTSIIVEVY